MNIGDGIKVFGFSFCLDTQRLIVTLHEKQLDFQLIPRPRSGFVDGNFTKYANFQASRVIAEYIAHEYKDLGTDLLPDDDEESQKKYVARINLEEDEFGNHAKWVIWHEVFKTNFDDFSFDRDYDHHKKELIEGVKKLEKVLESSKFLAGERFTLVDLNLIPEIQYLLQTENKQILEDSPVVMKWAKIYHYKAFCQVDLMVRFLIWWILEFMVVNW